MTVRWERCTPTLPAKPCRAGIDDHHGWLFAAARTIREMIAASIDVIIQAERLRDGSRRITNITEVMGSKAT